MFKNWKDILTKDYPKLDPESKFRFSCSKGISCFNKCCANVNIFLTPYDVLRLKKALHISSGEFLGKFTVPLLSEQKLSMVLLKMNDDVEKTCPFVTVEGCSVYQDRPWACRMYPVGTVPKSADPRDGNDFCFMAEKGSICMGTKCNRDQSIAEWFDNQGIDEYDRKNEPFNAITLHSLFREGKGLTMAKAQMFYVTLYDTDHFKELLFGSSFFNRFDIDEKLKQQIKTDDESLLDFCYNWTRFSLFGEDTIKIKGDITKRKKKTARVKAV